MPEKLKPCPFCGGEAESKELWNRDYEIECKKCGARSGEYLKEKYAIENWNRRVDNGKV